jgi:hypothetical protein
MNFISEDRLVAREEDEAILCNDCTIIARNSDRLAFVK